MLNAVVVVVVSFLCAIAAAREGARAAAALGADGGVPAASGGGEAMAKKFNVPFLGRLPLDNKMTGACEEGVSFLEEYPDSVAAPAFSKIVQGEEWCCGFGCAVVD